MTHLEANMADFEILYNAKGDPAYYRFVMGHCESIKDAVLQIKDMIASDDRDKSQSHVWTIRVSPHNKICLHQIFDNFAFCEEIARKQLRMF
jgi:hypothetical protein